MEGAKPSTSFRQSRCSSQAVPNQVISCAPACDMRSQAASIAIRVRPPPIEDSDLIMRVLSERSLSLVASPDLVAEQGLPEHLTDLACWPSFGLGQFQRQFSWCWTSPEKNIVDVSFTPRLVTTDMVALRNAALAGVGVVQLSKF